MALKTPANKKAKCIPVTNVVASEPVINPVAPLALANAPSGMAPAMIALITTIPVELEEDLTVPTTPAAIPRLS